MYEVFHVENFKGLKNVDVSLGRLTVLAGPHGCGKTSLLQAMHLFGEMRDTDPASVMARYGGERALRSVGVDEPLSLEGRGPGWGVRWTAAKNDYGYSQVRGSEAGVHGEPFATSRPINTVLPEAASKLPRAKLLQLEHRQMAAPSEATPHEPQLAASGEGLATLMAFLKTSDEFAAKRIIDALTATIPSIKNVRVRPATVPQTRPAWHGLHLHPLGYPGESTVAGHELVFDTTSGDGIPAHAVSEGALRVLGLLAVALGPKPPELLLLDDLDRGVYFGAMRALVQGLRTALEYSGGLHIVASTHSPYLLDHLELSEIRLMELANGGVRIGMMSDHPDFEWWSDVMGPGELWGLMDSTAPLAGLV